MSRTYLESLENIGNNIANTSWQKQKILLLWALIRTNAIFEFNEIL